MEVYTESMYSPFAKGSLFSPAKKRIRIDAALIRSSYSALQRRSSLYIPERSGSAHVCRL